MDAIAVLRLALKVLSERLIVMLTIILGFILALYVMSWGDWTRVACLAIFLTFSYLVVRRIGANHETAQTTE